MKLRIKGNSVRLRLGRSEVEEFGRTGKVQEKVRFGTRPQDTFCYQIEKGRGDEVSASFLDGKITVYVPDRIAGTWVETEQIGFEGSQVLDDKTELYILIEKDFVCLSEHDRENQSDKYPHPKGEDAC